MKERVYLGSFELYREYGGDGRIVNLERETLHLIDDKQRVALVETRTQGNDGSLAQLIRYQFSNHLDSVCLELDDQAKIMSYEEYYPYGSTSYQAVRSQTETPKRYRYTGKERDEETGLSYHGVRYYAPWVGRWTAADPAGMVDGPNLYAFVRANPVRLLDPTGQQGGPQGQMWFYEARVFWQRVTATAAGRGFTETIKQNAQKVYEMFGGKGTADLAHMEKPQALLKGGESTWVAPLERSPNRKYGAEVERPMVEEARAKGEFTRTGKYDPNVPLGTRFQKPPQSPIFESPAFKGWNKPTAPAAPAAPLAPEAVQKSGANPNQLELPFEKASSVPKAPSQTVQEAAPAVQPAEPGLGSPQAKISPSELELGRSETGKGGVGGVALLAIALIVPQLAKRHAEHKQAWENLARIERLERGEADSPHAASIGATPPEQLNKYWQASHEQRKEAAREWDWIFDLFRHPSLSYP